MTSKNFKRIPSNPISDRFQKYISFCNICGNKFYTQKPNKRICSDCNSKQEGILLCD